VLRLLAESPGELTASEVATHLGVHRSVAYRLLMALVHERFAARDDKGRYRVGADLVGMAALVRPTLREVADPVLRDLADRQDATACIVVRDGADAVAVTVIEPISSGPRFSYRVGVRNPLHAGAGGLAVLAAQAPAPDDTDRVRETRERGYAITSQEVVPGAYAVAAPIRADHPDAPAGVLLITHREDVAEAAIAPVVEAARRIAAALTA
jgi:DNA-binding IclR family transcriptional regulator